MIFGSSLICKGNFLICSKKPRKIKEKGRDGITERDCKNQHKLAFEPLQNRVPRGAGLRWRPLRSRSADRAGRRDQVLLPLPQEKSWNYVVSRLFIFLSTSKAIRVYSCLVVLSMFYLGVMLPSRRLSTTNRDKVIVIVSPKIEKSNVKCHFGLLCRLFCIYKYILSSWIYIWKVMLYDIYNDNVICYGKNKVVLCQRTIKHSNSNDFFRRVHMSVVVKFNL